MGFFFQDDYWEAVSELPVKQRREVIVGIVEYYFTLEEPSFKGAPKAVFCAVRERVKKARQEADRKRKERGTGGESSADKPRTDCGTSLNKEGEGEDIPNGISPPIVPQRDTPFWVSCLAILNETLGTTYTTMPEKCRHMLERSSQAYAPEDVRKMIVYKRDEWREKDRKSNTTYSKNLTPNTLFSPDHFEQYMHQSKDANEANDYAKYDRS